MRACHGNCWEVITNLKSVLNENCYRAEATPRHRRNFIVNAIARGTPQMIRVDTIVCFKESEILGDTRYHLEIPINGISLIYSSILYMVRHRSHGYWHACPASINEGFFLMSVFVSRQPSHRCFAAGARPDVTVDGHHRAIPGRGCQIY